MTPKKAVAIAKEYVADIFAAEGAKHVGLEELRFDAERAQWLVTIGFTRPWDGAPGVTRWAYDQGDASPRTFKTVEIDDTTGRVIELRHWPAAA